ncbi:MAG: hypothetical protein GEV03_12710 [Streptosporangiales bacterium]|nr:hypothetical protein [Streptosporangiales bacterium]
MEMYGIFTTAFQDLYPRAVRLAQRIVGDRAAAEDVAAEAMTRAFSNWTGSATRSRTAPAGCCGSPPTWPSTAFAAGRRRRSCPATISRRWPTSGTV